MGNTWKSESEKPCGLRQDSLIGKAKPHVQAKQKPGNSFSASHRQAGVRLFISRKVVFHHAQNSYLGRQVSKHKSSTFPLLPPAVYVGGIWYGINLWPAAVSCIAAVPNLLCILSCLALRQPILTSKPSIQIGSWRDGKFNGNNTMYYNHNYFTEKQKEEVAAEIIWA